MFYPLSSLFYISKYKQLKNSTIIDSVKDYQWRQIHWVKGYWEQDIQLASKYYPIAHVLTLKGNPWWDPSYNLQSRL